MKNKIYLVLLLLLWAQNAYAWESDNVTTGFFQFFFIPLILLFLISFIWAKNSTLVKIVVTLLSAGFILLLITFSIMFYIDRDSLLYKTVGGFLLLIIFTWVRKKDHQQEEGI